jgi:hypothetical protein
MKLFLVVFGFLFSVGALAQSARCVSEDAQHRPVAVLMNIDNLMKVGAFQVHFQFLHNEPIQTPVCKAPNHLPEVYCMAYMPAPGSSYFLKFNSFNPTAPVNHGQLFAYSYGKNNQLLTNVVCSGSDR